jgi:tetratricopeptide (TPR) repeat protein
MTSATNASAARPALKWAAFALVAVGALWAVENWVNRPPAPTVHVWEDSPYSSVSFGRSHAQAMKLVDVGVANARAAADAGSDQWLMHEILAGQYLMRAQLSGSYDDYAGAERALAAAFKVAVPKSGPHMMNAKLDFSMHRLAGAETQLAAMDRYAIKPAAATQAEMAAMRGDIAFYRGEYKAALALYDRADALVPGTSIFRRAIYASRTGAIEQADAMFARNIADLQPPVPQVRAYLELQRGILDLDRGRLDDAMAHFRDGDRIFPGHWLIEEHMAEVLTLQGKTDEAQARYRDIVRRTGHPEFLDALAAIAEQRGDTVAAKQLYAQAWAIWTRRIEQFPQAAYGHAIDHCLAKRDWPCALQLAEKNHAARPFGEAKVILARALLANGRAAEARTMIETVLASPWRTADLHRVAADIYTAMGMPADAATQVKLAHAINRLA